MSGRPPSISSATSASIHAFRQGDSDVGTAERQALSDAAAALGWSVPNEHGLTRSGADALHAAFECFKPLTSLPVEERILFALRFNESDFLASSGTRLFDHLSALAQAKVIDPDQAIELQENEPRKTVLQLLLSGHSAADPGTADTSLRRATEWIDRAGASLDAPADRAHDVSNHDALRCALAHPEPHTADIVGVVLDRLATRPGERERAQDRRDLRNDAAPLAITTDPDIFAALLDKRYDHHAYSMLKQALTDDDPHRIQSLLDRLSATEARISAAVLNADETSARALGRAASDSALPQLVDAGLDPIVTNRFGRNVLHLAHTEAEFLQRADSIHTRCYAPMSDPSIGEPFFRDAHGNFVVNERWSHASEQASGLHIEALIQRDTQGRRPQDVARANQWREAVRLIDEAQAPGFVG